MHETQVDEMQHHDVIHEVSQESVDLSAESREEEERIRRTLYGNKEEKQSEPLKAATSEKANA